MTSSAMPPLSPRLYHEPGAGEFYEDGRVFGAVDTFEHAGGKAIVIHEWFSSHPSHGCSRRALAWLREQGFKHIVANGVGRTEDGIPDISTTYWQYMHAQGLVDVLLDDDGLDITPPLIERAASRRPPLRP